MFDLVYNIDFEIAALFFAVIMFVEVWLCYPRHSRKNRIFRWMTTAVIVTESMDIVTAFTITYGATVPRWLNWLANDAYFMTGLFLCFLLDYYIESEIIPPEGRHILLRANKLILLLMELSVVLNGVGKYYFEISPQGEYLHGPLFLMLHIASCYFVFCASVSLFANSRLLNISQRVSGFLFVALYFAAIVLQTFIVPDVLLIMPTATLMVMITVFSLESPDFAKLQNTLEELTETKKKLEETSDKYYRLAYMDIMTGLKNRAAYSVRIKELKNGENKDSVIALIADLNNLKYLNDNFGHQAGDKALMKVAEQLKNNFTDGCECYRIGGDEFAVLAYGISEEEFLEKYHRFQNAVMEESKHSEYPFSVAVGYQNTDAVTLSQALKMADEKMYQDKRRSKQSF